MPQGAPGWRLTRVQDAPRAVAKTRRALAQATAERFTLGLDDARMEATRTILSEHHRQAIAHRAMVAAMSPTARRSCCHAQHRDATADLRLFEVVHKSSPSPSCHRLQCRAGSGGLSPHQVDLACRSCG